jgi:hypothetical protein
VRTGAHTGAHNASTAWLSRISRDFESACGGSTPPGAIRHGSPCGERMLSRTSCGDCCDLGGNWNTVLPGCCLRSRQRRQRRAGERVEGRGPFPQRGPRPSEGDVARADRDMSPAVDTCPSRQGRRSWAAMAEALSRYWLRLGRDTRPPIPIPSCPTGRPCHQRTAPES